MVFYKKGIEITGPRGAIALESLLKMTEVEGHLKSTIIYQFFLANTCRIMQLTNIGVQPIVHQKRWIRIGKMTAIPMDNLWCSFPIAALLSIQNHL